MFSATYRRYALGMMTAVYTLNFVDRGLMILLLQPIKEDLRLSDTQLGFLTGIAFAVFYAIAGIPIARWADCRNRVTVASLAIGLWGVTVMACVLVTSYAQLVIARIAAAVGEAGGKPPTYSLVGDYFPGPVERTRAMAVYWLGSPLSALFSFILGGWLNERYGWRLTFFLVGIPGLILALLVKVTIRETRGRRHVQKMPLPPMREVLGALWNTPSCRQLCMALILLYTLGSGLAPWYAAFMMRSHGMSTAELGIWLGLTFGLGGVAGILLGGHVASRWFAGNERGQMRATSLMVAALLPCYVAFFLLPHKHGALLTLIPLNLMSTFFMAPTYALMQRLVPDQMRATTLAVVMLLANLIGMGIGPQIVGVLSDLLMPSAGVESLRYAMLAMSLVSLWTAYHFWQAGRSVQNDLAAGAGP